MQDLLPRAERISRLLKDRGETIVVAESSTGGLVSAALLAMPGASAYFLGGAIVYTQTARKALIDLADISELGLPPRPSLMRGCWRKRRANALRRPGPWPRAAQPDRPAIAMATLLGIAASPGPGRS